MIIGVFGCTRVDELVRMSIEDIEEQGRLLYINIPETKTGFGRAFTICDLEYIDLIQRYIKLRPNNMPNKRFFIRYENGKCVRQVVGHHTLSSVPRKIAEFLKLPDVELYTGTYLNFLCNKILLVDGVIYKIILIRP